MDFKSHEVLKTECDEGRQWGFTGKQVIHPSQVDLVQQSFLPAQSDVDRAKKIVAGAHDHSSRGIGAFNLDGKMIDMPMVKWAQRILARSEK